MLITSIDGTVQYSTAQYSTDPVIPGRHLSDSRLYTSTDPESRVWNTHGPSVDQLFRELCWSGFHATDSRIGHEHTCYVEIRRRSVSRFVGCPVDSPGLSDRDRANSRQDHTAIHGKRQSIILILGCQQPTSTKISTFCLSSIASI